MIHQQQCSAPNGHYDQINRARSDQQSDESEGAAVNMEMADGKKKILEEKRRADNKGKKETAVRAATECCQE
jgi:hypothetical protein